MRSAQHHRQFIQTSLSVVVVLFATALITACQSNLLTPVQLPSTPSPVSAYPAAPTAPNTAVAQAHLTTAVAVAAPSPALPDPRLGASAQGLKGYVTADNTGAIFIQWTETGSSLSGTMLVAQPDGKSQSGTKTTTANFTGVRSGNHLSLILPQGLGLSTTIAAELNEPFLTMYFPDNRGTITPVTLHPGTAAEFNDAVITLQQQAQQQVAQEQVYQATIAANNKQGTATASALSLQQKTVANANARLAEALRQLASDTSSLPSHGDFSGYLPSYADDWASMQADDREMRKEAANSPRNCTYVQIDLTHITIDQTHIGIDHDNVTRVSTQLNDNIGTVKQDIQSVRAAYMTLQGAVTANTTGAPAPQFTQEDVTKAVNAAQQEIDKSTSASQNARNQAADYDQKAADLLKNAKSFVAGLKCQ